MARPFGHAYTVPPTLPVKPPGIAELGEDRDRAQLADSVVRGDQRLAPGLPAGIVTQLLRGRGELHVERVDHRQRDGDLLAGGLRQPLRGEPFATIGGHQVTLVRGAVVIEHRLDPLLPLGPLMRERVPAADPGAEIEGVSQGLCKA